MLIVGLLHMSFIIMSHILSAPYLLRIFIMKGLPQWLSGKESACNAEETEDMVSGELDSLKTTLVHEWLSSLMLSVRKKAENSYLSSVPLFHFQLHIYFLSYTRKLYFSLFSTCCSNDIEYIFLAPDYNSS